MREGELVLALLPQADGQSKNRPALFLRALPPFGDALLCGVSTQLAREVKGFDEVITASDADFSSRGLVAASLFRLGFLAVIPVNQLVGSIGHISTERHQRLLRNLGEYLLKK